MGTFTVPTGCKVVYVEVGDRQGREVSLYNRQSRKNWAFGLDGDGIVSRYIGVTPGKTYTLVLGAEDTDFAYGWVYYSAEINTHTPDVTDY